MVTKDEFIIGRQTMKCSSHEAEIRKYRWFKGKSGARWLVADQPNEGDNVYVEEMNPNGGHGFQGFGGRTLTFPLINGGEIKLKAPWMSNSNALFNDTGHDVRNKHLTFVVIAKKRDTIGPHYNTRLSGILYKDDNWTIGLFDRGKHRAQMLANKLGHSIYLYSESQGGSSCGPVDPDKK